MITLKEISLENIDDVLTHYTNLSQLKTSLESQTYTPFKPILRHQLNASIENLSPYIEQEHIHASLESAQSDMISYSTIISIEGVLGTIWDKIKGFFAGIGKAAKATKDAIVNALKRLVASKEMAYLMKNDDKEVSSKHFTYMVKLTSGDQIKLIKDDYRRYPEVLAQGGKAFHAFYQEVITPKAADAAKIILRYQKKNEDIDAMNEELTHTYQELYHAIDAKKLSSVENNPWGISVVFERKDKPAPHFKLNDHAVSTIAKNYTNGSTKVPLKGFIYDFAKHVEDATMGFLFGYIAWANGADAVWSKAEDKGFADVSAASALSDWLTIYRGLDCLELAKRFIYEIDDMIKDMYAELSDK